MAGRVALTKKQAASEAGTSLLSLLKRVTADGELSLGDVQEMREWLAANANVAEVPAISWLHELVGLVLADGRVTADERVELLLAIERVLPMDERVLAKKRREVAEQATETDEPASKASGKNRPATDRQIDYLMALGVTESRARGLTVATASDLIDSLVGTRRETVSNRQLMVLRFWNRMELAVSGKDGVSAWMDDLYERDPSHREAWEIWKQEHPECRRGQEDPRLVPVGAGATVLDRARQQLANAAAGSSPPPRDNSSTTIAILIIVAVVAAIWATTK